MSKIRRIEIFYSKQSLVEEQLKEISQQLLDSQWYDENPEEVMQILQQFQGVTEQGIFDYIIDCVIDLAEAARFNLGVFGK